MRRAFEKVVAQIMPEATLLSFERLRGGVSAEATLLEIRTHEGNVERWVVRRHSARDLAFNPDVARCEFGVLDRLPRFGVPAPTPLLFDESGTVFPTPYVVLGYVAGSVVEKPADLSSFVDRLAHQLRDIHAVPLEHGGFDFLPDLREQMARLIASPPAELDETLGEGRIRKALERLWPFPQVNPPVLLHGDYWHRNVIWQDSEIAAVIDWEDAALGDPLADLAVTRLEMLWAFGPAAMQRFTETYVAATDIDTAASAHWDLYAALGPCGWMHEWGLPKQKEALMRRCHCTFVDYVLERLRMA